MLRYSWVDPRANRQPAVGYGVYFALLHTSYLGIYSLPNFASFRLVDLGLALLIGVIAGFIGVMFKVIGTIKLKGDRKDCQMSGDDIQKDYIFVLGIFFNPNHTIGRSEGNHRISQNCI